MSPYCFHGWGLSALFTFGWLQSEISEGHSRLVLLVKGTEQIPLHVAPVIMEHFSLRRSRQKAVQSPFIQVHGRNTRARTSTTLYPMGQMHPGVTLQILANIKSDAMSLSCYLVVFCGRLQLFPLHIYTTSLDLIFWNVKVSETLQLSDAPGTPIRKPGLLGNLTWLGPPRQSDPQKVPDVGSNVLWL